MLHATLAKQRGVFGLDATLDVNPAEPLVIVGESGSGKTTLLRLLAGVDRADAGSIRVDDATWLDLDVGTDLPAWRRSVGYVSQDYALFPHLSALENVAFGLRARGSGARDARGRAAEELKRFGIADLAARRPDQLSGGQQQRVALARALVLDPRLLLLDEPLAALDLQTRQAVRSELRTLLASLRGLVVYVTHHPADALLLGARVAVMESGRLTQVGTREDLLRHPRSAYVAAFVGVNLFRGTVVARSHGVAQVRTDRAVLEVADPGAGDGDVFVVVNPREVTLYTTAPSSSARNNFKGPIVELAAQPPDGDRVRVVLGTEPPLVAEVVQSTVASLGLTEGREVFAGFKATGVTTYR
ncbi:MAG TPA: ABC transporter ATP-binding protein [Gemmatimonadales bacterium]